MISRPKPVTIIPRGGVAIAINCYITLNSQTLYPELPVLREYVIVAEDRRMLNGSLRRAHRATKYRFTLTIRDVDETTRTTWINAAPLTAAATYVDEFGVSRSVIITEVRNDLSRTEPSVEGGLSTTGPGYYDLTIACEEV